jgi:VanZ family protein
MRLILVKEIFTTGILVLGLHLLALRFFLYWTTSWFDLLTHFLGGFLIALIMFSFMNRIQRSEEKVNDKLLIASVVLAVLVVGLSWELWELFTGLSDVIEDKVDAIVDLIMDLIGSVVAVLYYYFLITKRK